MRQEVHLSVNGWLMQIGGKGCGKCSGFVEDYPSYVEGKFVSQWRCIECGERVFPDWVSTRLGDNEPHRPVGKARVIGSPKLENIPLEDLQNCDPRLLADRYECSPSLIYKEAMRRGVKRQFWNSERGLIAEEAT